MRFIYLILGLITITHKKWVLTFFVYPENWQWGYKHNNYKVFPYWETQSFSIGPLFTFFINHTDMEEWLKLKNPVNNDKI